MGSLAQSDFVSEIIAGLGNRTDITTQRIVNVLNLSQSRLSRAYDFTEMQQIGTTPVPFTGVGANDKFLALPTGIKTIHSLVLVDNTASPGSLGNSRKMTEKPWRWFDQRFPVPEYLSPGWPSIYTRWGNIASMVPVPSATFQAQLRWTSWPTALSVSATTQVSDFDNKDDILIYLSLAYLWNSLGRAEKAAPYMQEAVNATKEAIKREGTRPDMEVSRDISTNPIGDSNNYWADPFIRAVYT